MGDTARQIWFIIFGVVLFLGLVFAVGFSAISFAQAQTYSSFRSLYSDAAVDSSKVFASDMNMTKRVDFTSLPDDVVGWIYAPGTRLDAPLVQEESVASSFYLTHDIDRNLNFLGAVAEAGQVNGESGGYRLITASSLGAFASLSDEFATLDDACAHPYLYEYRADSVTRWRVWAASSVDVRQVISEYPVPLASDRYAGVLKTIEGGAAYEIGQMPSVFEQALVVATAASIGSFGEFMLVYVPDVYVDFTTEEVTSASSGYVPYGWMNRCTAARNEISNAVASQR